MHTTAYWLTLSRELMAALPFAADDRRDGVVGLSFAMRQVAQLLLMCDRQDIGVSIGKRRAWRRPIDEARRALTRSGLSGVAARGAAHLHLRQLSGRHRLQRAAVPHARRPAGADARADRALRVRARVPDVRRPGRRHRAAGQDGGAAHSRVDFRQARPRSVPARLTPQTRCRSSASLADRLRGHCSAAGRLRRRAASLVDAAPRPSAADVLGGEWCGDYLVVERTYSPGHRHGRTALADARPSDRGLASPRTARWRRLALPVPRSRDDRARRWCRHLRLPRGLAWFDGCSFACGSSSSRASPAERVLLEARCATSPAESGTVVTYNGKIFDLPLLETRYVLHRHAKRRLRACRTWTCCTLRDACGGRPVSRTRTTAGEQLLPPDQPRTDALRPRARR